jgi:hypothetical protein
VTDKDTSDSVESMDIPDQVMVIFRAFEQGFQMRHRVALGRLRPAGTKTDFYVMMVIPRDGDSPVPLAVIPADNVLDFIWQHATLVERHGLPLLPAKLN